MKGFLCDSTRTRRSGWSESPGGGRHISAGNSIDSSYRFIDVICFRQHATRLPGNAKAY